jgi:hypothetical protein
VRSAGSSRLGTPAEGLGNVNRSTVGDQERSPAKSDSHGTSRHAEDDEISCLLAVEMTGKYPMVNKDRNRRNQPPTGEGKHQSTVRGEPRKLEKRSEVVQAQRHHPELNLGDADEEAANAEGDQPNPKRPKAGR